LVADAISLCEPGAVGCSIAYADGSQRILSVQIGLRECAMRHRVLTIKCYRETIGDTDLEDIPIVGTPFKNAKEVTRLHLITYVEDEAIPPASKPRGASLVGDDGRILATFKVRPLSAGAVTIEETRTASRIG
jgi:hypothetical protein